MASDPSRTKDSQRSSAHFQRYMGTYTYIFEISQHVQKNSWRPDNFFTVNVEETLTVCSLDLRVKKINTWDEE